MRFNVITLFPELIEGALKFGVVGQAVQRGSIEIQTINPRKYTEDIHHTVDDRPFGGGDGMVLLCAPLTEAIADLGKNAGRRILLSAHGKKWSDSNARDCAKLDQNITLICGRYGGVDQRFINQNVDEEISIGDYILSGGELGALVLIDSISRFLPSVLGNEKSFAEESFGNDGLLEAPLFTRPRQIEGGASVPAIFLSGDHAKIAAARRLLSILVTIEKRPDLVRAAHFLELKKLTRSIKEISIEDYLACGISKNTLNKINGDHL